MSMLTEHAHQDPAVLWRRLAGGSLLLTGLGHLATEAFAPGTPERTAMLTTMRGWQVALPGAARSVEELFSGFSLMMGLLLIGCGALVATARPTRGGSVVLVALTLTATVAAWRYFFPVPGVLTSIAAAAALKAWWSGRRGLVHSV
jgi:uncharacterized membrane protein YphA (DoxX/SURF4 family)